jgi:hypothetical protein
MLKREFKTYIILILTFIIGCSAQVNYVGKEYDPTANVDIYYSKEEIKNEYEIIGHAVGSGGDFVSNDKIQEGLISEAKSKGADAILITGVEKSNIPTGGGSTNEKQIKASFLKYK